MRKFIRRMGNVVLLLICMNLIWGCAKEQERLEKQPENGALEDTVIEAEDQDLENEKDTAAKEKAEEPEEENQEEKDRYQKNQELFYEAADEHGIAHGEADKYFALLCRDNVFQDGAMELTGLMIEDMDGNGQKDMLVMVLDGEERPFYGGGCIWFYMNEDKPYCFDDEACSYYGWFDAFWADIDNDENVEIVFSTQGTGCGAAGDSCKVVLKYKDHNMEQMELPSELTDDAGIYVDVTQYPEENSYSAYCGYLDETVLFQSDNIEDWERPKTAQYVGGNVRGFYDLCCVEYEGKNALQASEYLHGEGGIAHWVGTAQFLIVWDEKGNSSIAKWWIEGSDASYSVGEAQG